MENTIDLMEIKEAVYTQEDYVQLAKLKDRPIEFDEYCPETTPEQAVKFRRVNPVRQYAN